jgi:outer membrane protein TolC
VALAVERNEAGLAAEERHDAARARAGRARGALLPSLTIEGDYTRRGYETVREVGDDDVVIQSRNALSELAILRQPFFDMRLIPLYRAARRARDAAHLESAETKRQVGFAAATAFLNALSQEQVLAAAMRRLELATKTLSDASARFEAQIVSSNDVTRAELELASAERELTRARGEQESAYLELASVMNATIESPLVPPDDILAQAAAPPAGAAESMITEAQRRRLDLGAQRLTAEASHSTASEPMLRLLPRFDLVGQAEHTNEGGLAGRENDWFARIELTWPLFDGGQREAERAERAALADAADLEVRALERQVELEVRTALVALTSEQAANRQAEIAANVARRNAAEAAELYRQGLASALEAADANVRLFEAEVARARAGYGVAEALMGLRAALGLDAMGGEPSL